MRLATVGALPITDSKMSLQNFDPDELVKMIREIQTASACVVDFDGMMNRLETKLGDRRIGELIFDPPGGTPLSAEEIVERIMGKADS